MNEPVDVAVGILVESRPEGRRVLIARRPFGYVLGGYWEFPGGKVEQHESPIDCLRREFDEELGICVSVTGRLPCVEHRYEHGRVRLHPFYCGRDGGEPRARAISEFRWVEPRALPAFRFPPANDVLIRRVVEELEPDAGCSNRDL